MSTLFQTLSLSCSILSLWSDPFGAQEPVFTCLEAAHEVVVQALQQVLDVVKIREVDLEDLQELSLTLWQLLGGQLKSFKNI